MSCSLTVFVLWNLGCHSFRHENCKLWYAISIWEYSYSIITVYGTLTYCCHWIITHPACCKQTLTANILFCIAWFWHAVCKLCPLLQSFYIVQKSRKPMKLFFYSPEFNWWLVIFLIFFDMLSEDLYCVCI